MKLLERVSNSPDELFDFNLANWGKSQLHSLSINWSNHFFVVKVPF